MPFRKKTPVKRHRGSRDTHGTHDQTNLTQLTNASASRPNQRPTQRPQPRPPTLELEPTTAPRGRLGRGRRRLRTRPSRLPLHRGSRTHETDTQTSQTTSKPTPTTDSRTRPHPSPGTHTSPQTTAHLSHPIKRVGGDGDGHGAQAREQRGSFSNCRLHPGRLPGSTGCRVCRVNVHATTGATALFLNCFCPYTHRT